MRAWVNGMKLVSDGGSVESGEGRAGIRGKNKGRACVSVCRLGGVKRRNQ